MWFKMKKKSLIIIFALSFMVQISSCYQKEFYVPYSETEDVDFSISRSDGCFQWSTDALEAISLSPIHLNYQKYCGHVLEFQVLAKAAHSDKETVFKIYAENVDENIEPDAPSIFEYTIHVQPVAKLELMGLKQKIKINDPPVPFGVTGFDREGNEFDTLDGLQIRWFIGSDREVLAFQSHLNDHTSTTHVRAKASGKASIIATLEDPNYSSVEPAFIEVNVLSPLKVEPDGVFLLPGGEVEFRLFEEVSTENNEFEFKEISTLGENPLYTFEVKDESIASLDKASSLVSALKEEEDETSLLVKNRDGEIVKHVPIRITTADSMAIRAYPTPDKVQLLDGEEYEIKVEIFNKDKRPIYPSKNILCKTSYPSQFKVKELSENGLWAKIHTVSVGRGRVKAHLRSVLTPDDEEIEISPHLRANVDFEVYTRIKMKPQITVLPWDANMKTEFDLNYKVTGGSNVYQYSVDDEEMGVSLGNGRFRTLGIKAGSFNVRASMANNEHIYAESEVHIIEPEDLSMDNHQSEIHVQSSLRIPVFMFGSIPEAEDPVSFIDCSDLPFELKMNNEEDFKFEMKDSRGNGRIGGSCASIFVSCSKPGATTNISVVYENPTTKNALMVTKPFQCYSSMTLVNPVQERTQEKAIIYLAIGSTSKVIINDGPLPWHKSQDSFFRQVEIEDPDIIRVKRVSQEDDYEKNVYDVTCIDEGKSSFILTIGNKATKDNPFSAKESREIHVSCSVPKKINVVLKDIESNQKVNFDSSSGKVLLNKSKGLRLSLVLKDGEGHTIEGLESVKFNLKISDDTLLRTRTESFVVPKSADGHVPIPARPFVDLQGQNKIGEVDVEVSVVGYKETVFKSLGIPMPKPLPAEEEEDEEGMLNEYEDTLTFKLLSVEDIASYVP